MNKFVSFVLLLVIGWFTFKALVRPGYFPMHDDMQAMRVLEMRKCFDDGQFPCRWVPDMGFGYGYPQFNFYPPLPYYLMTSFTYLGFGYLNAVKLGFILSMLMSGIGMWLLARRYWGNTGGLTSALFYLYLPYRANNLYVRGAMGEIWAMAWFPWIFWALEKFLKDRSWKSVFWLSMGMFGLATSHLLSVIMILPFLIIWFCWRFYDVFFVEKGNSWKGLLKKSEQWNLNLGVRKITILSYGGLRKLLIAGLLAFGLSAFYVLPVVFEKKYAHFETLTMGYFNYLAHFVGLDQLLFSTYWGYGSSIFGPNDGMSFAVGILHWTIPLVSLLIGFSWRKKFSSKFISVLLLVFFSWIYLFLVHPKATFLWQSLRFLEILQFPWRFLSIVGFLNSFAVGSIFFWNKFASKKLLLWLVIPLVILNLGYFKPDKWFNINDSQHFADWDKYRTISIFDYLPIAASHPPAKGAPDSAYFISGEGNVLSYTKGSDWQKGTIFVSKSGKLRVPLYDFPGMKVWVDGKQVEIDSRNELGLITVLVGVGNHTIEVKLVNTWIRTVGNFLTIITISFFVFFFLGKFKNLHGGKKLLFFQSDD